MKIAKICLIALVIFCNFGIYANEYHVSINGSDNNSGSLSKPFRTISNASKIALPGDSIIVHDGTYREWVSPVRGGTNELNRIVYKAAPGETVTIKGSEVIKNWENLGKGVWKVTLKNSFFGSYNPYQDTIKGDWFDDKGRAHHTGEVYLNEKSMYEVTSLERVKTPTPFSDSKKQDCTLYQWYCESHKDTTTIWANFHDYNPNKELVEINVRKSCFYPNRPGINYITVTGFHMSQAATQWAPPTAEQIGLLGTHWSKGWIIEGNTISDSKCVGITLGKDRASGQNVWLNNPIKDGATSYNEVIFRALNNGWCKDNIGSHNVLGNKIFNCEQAGIVGSLGAVFSKISDNHIFNINTKKMFSGAEIAGIKIHASIDMIISNNRVNRAPRGIWIDWMAQGTRITGNILHNNTIQDFFSEVNHGPYLVDNNIMLSDISITDWSEGGAFVHNLINGKIQFRQVLNRFTPYHLPHSTKISGLRNIHGGNNKFYNNIFIKKADEKEDYKNISSGFYGLNGYNKAKFSNIAGGNIYYNGAKPGKTDSNFVVNTEFNPKVSIEEKNNHLYLNIKYDSGIEKIKNPLITTKLLGATIISEAIYDDPCGFHYILNRDFMGKSRNQKNPTPGPFEQIGGEKTYKIW